MNATIATIATSDPTDDVAGLHEPVDAATILDNVRALDELVQQEAAPSNAQHFMTERMGRALAAAGVYRAAFPAGRGGPEMSLVDQTRLVEMIARRDASIAWNATVLLATGFYAARLGDAAFAELYPDLDRPTCGSFHPKGVARPVEGGYLVTGDWKFGSAIRSSYHIVAGVEVVDAAGEPVRKEDGSQLTLGVWLPVDAVTLRDDWHTIGLRGSGSQGYAVTDAFVPAGHCFDRFFAPTADTAPLAKHVDLPFYSMAGISVGIAQHALDVALADLRSRPPRPGTRRAVVRPARRDRRLRAGGACARLRMRGPHRRGDLHPRRRAVARGARPRRRAAGQRVRPSRRRPLRRPARVQGRLRIAAARATDPRSHRRERPRVDVAQPVGRRRPDAGRRWGGLS